MKAAWISLAIGFVVVMLCIWCEYIGEQFGRTDQRQRDAKEIAALKLEADAMKSSCTMVMTENPSGAYCAVMPICPPGSTCGAGLPICPPGALCRVP